MMLSENGAQQPASIADAANYKSQQNLPDGIFMVADPGYQKISGAVQLPGSLGLPFMMLLGGDMEILGIDITPQNFLQIVQDGGGPTIEATCAGSCGQQALAGCYCDPSCEQYNDCCPDYAEQCK